MVSKIGEVDAEFCRIKLHPHLKHSAVQISMFVGVQNVAIVTVDEIRNCRDHAFLIRARDK